VQAAPRLVVRGLDCIKLSLTCLKADQSMSRPNAATRTDARSKTGTYSYDELSCVTSIAYTDLTTSFTYDTGTNGKGHLTGASDANHSLSFTYDAQGRVTGKSQTVGSVTKSVSYGYANGNLTSLVTPSGQTIGYGYTEGRISSITLNGGTTILDQVLYEPFGPVSGWRWGNATYAVRVYDTDARQRRSTARAQAITATTTRSASPRSPIRWTARRAGPTATMRSIG
jgi:YD repeat-containing protein